MKREPVTVRRQHGGAPIQTTGVRLTPNWLATPDVPADPAADYDPTGPCDVLLHARTGLSATGGKLKHLRVFAAELEALVGPALDSDDADSVAEAIVAALTPESPTAWFERRAREIDDAASAKRIPRGDDASLTTAQRLARIRPAWKGATLVRVERVSGSEWVPESAEDRRWRERNGYSRPQRKAVFDAVRVEHPSGAVAHIKWDGVFNVVPGTVL